MGLSFFYFAEDADTAFVVASLSDTIWKVNVNTGAVTTALMRFEGFGPPRLPPTFPVDKSYSWANAFYRAWRPVAGFGVVAIPFARGFLDDNDGQAGLIRSRGGQWLAIENAPTIVGTVNGDVVGREVDDHGAVRINFYRVTVK